jgi:hypothetical protein
VKLAMAVFALLCCCAAVSAQDPTLGQAMNQVLDEAAERCPLESESIAPGQSNPGKLRVRISQLGNHATCECMPKRIREALQTTDPAELSRQIDLEQVSELVISRFLTPCLGDAFRELFSGEACEELFPLSDRAPGSFCACMKPRLREYSDAEAVELGNAYSTYAALRQKARQEGKAPPPRPPIADRLFAAVTACGGQVRTP